MKISEVRQRFVWLWRLGLSTHKEEFCYGERKAFWIFDTENQPDGAVLRPFIQLVAIKYGLTVSSFGPDKRAKFKWVRSILTVILNIQLIFSSKFLDHFRLLLISRIDKLVKHNEIILVGSCKGKFADIAISTRSDLKIWEIQHGMLDISYFPIRADHFFARSTYSETVIKKRDNIVKVEIISNDLNPPRGKLVTNSKNINIKKFVCYSKNPGGNCSLDELTNFEAACEYAAKLHGFTFSIQLHPRDNVYKLLLRHRNLKPLIWVARGWRSAKDSARLVVSAYSSSLVSNSVKGDYLINVRIATPDNIAVEQYEWLPSISLDSLRTTLSTVPFFLRES